MQNRFPRNNGMKKNRIKKTRYQQLELDHDVSQLEQGTAAHGWVPPELDLLRVLGELYKVSRRYRREL
jgi:hypothetical protein